MRSARFLMPGSSTRSAWFLIVIALVGMCFRTWIVAHREWLGYDESNYLMIGRSVSAGLGYVQSALTPYYAKFHLLPIIVPRWLALALQDELLASNVLFVILGGATVGLTGILGQSLFTSRVGLLSAAMAAIAPPLTSLMATSISHSLYLPLLVSALIAAWASVRDYRPILAALAGVLVGFCWWARADGLLAAIFFVPMLLVSGTLLTGPRKAVKLTLLFALAFGVIYASYALAVSRVSGGASIPHGPLFDFLQYPPSCESSRPLDSYESFLRVVVAEPRCVWQKVLDNLDAIPGILFTWTGFPVVLMPLIGAAVMGEPRFDRAVIAAYSLLLFAMVPLAGYLPFYYQETRYVAPYSVPFLIWCARGALLLGDRLDLRGRLQWHRMAPGALAVGFLFSVSLVHTPQIRSASGPEYVGAGRWLAENSEPEAIVWTTQSQVAFYSHRAWRYPPHELESDLLSHTSGPSTFVVVDQRGFFQQRPHWGSLEAVEAHPRLEVVYRDGFEDFEIEVFRVREPTIQGTAKDPIASTDEASLDSTAIQSEDDE